MRQPHGGKSTPAALGLAGVLTLFNGACVPHGTQALADEICRSTAPAQDATGRRVDLGALTLWIPRGWSVRDPGYFDHGGVVLGEREELVLINGYVGPTSFGDEVAECAMSVNGLSLTIYAFRDEELQMAAVVGKIGDYPARMRPVLSARDPSEKGMRAFLGVLHSLQRGSAPVVRSPDGYLPPGASSTR